MARRRRSVSGLNSEFIIASFPLTSLAARIDDLVQRLIGCENRLGLVLARSRQMAQSAVAK